jgi:hypothetical protein
MTKEQRMIQKLIEILEPSVLKEAQYDMDILGFLTEGTEQSIAKIIQAKEMIKNNGV